MNASPTGPSHPRVRTGAVSPPWLRSFISTRREHRSQSRIRVESKSGIGVLCKACACDARCAKHNFFGIQWKSKPWNTDKPTGRSHSWHTGSSGEGRGDLRARGRLPKRDLMISISFSNKDDNASEIRAGSRTTRIGRVPHGPKD